MDAPPFPAAAIDAARGAIKAYLRIEGTGEDAAIDAAARTALALGEAFTGTAWIAREWQAILSRSGGWHRLPTAPVTAITSVAALAPDGTAAILPLPAYAIDIDAQGGGWVRIAAAQPPARIRVTFTAGTAPAWDGVAPPLAQGAVLLAAHLLESRGAAAAPPAAVAALWRPWRRVRLCGGRRASCSIG